MPTIPNAVLTEAAASTEIFLEQALAAIRGMAPASVAESIRTIAPNASVATQELLEASLYAGAVLAIPPPMVGDIKALETKILKIVEEEKKALVVQESPKEQQTEDKTSEKILDTAKKFMKYSATAVAVSLALDEHTEKQKKISEREKDMMQARHYEHHVKLAADLGAALIGYTLLPGMLPLKAGPLILPGMIVAAGAIVEGYTAQQALIKGALKTIDKAIGITTGNPMQKDNVGKGKGIIEQFTGRNLILDEQIQVLTNQEKHDFAELAERTVEMRGKIREYELSPEIHGTADNLALLQQDSDKTQLFYNRLEEHIQAIEKLQQQHPDYPDIDIKLEQFRQNLGVAQDDLDFLAKKTEKLQAIAASQDKIDVQKPVGTTQEQPSTAEREVPARPVEPVVSSITSYFRSWFASDRDESAKENAQPLITAESVHQSLLTKEERDLLGEDEPREPVRNPITSYFQSWFPAKTDEPTPEEPSQNSSDSTSAMFNALSPDGHIPPPSSEDDDDTPNETTSEVTAPNKTESDVAAPNKIDEEEEEDDASRIHRMID